MKYPGSHIRSVVASPWKRVAKVSFSFVYNGVTNKESGRAKRTCKKGSETSCKTANLSDV